MLIGVGEQTACKDGVAQAIAMAKLTNFSFFILIILNKTSAKVIIMFYFAIVFLKYLKHINAKALSLAQILKTVQEKGLLSVMFYLFVYPFMRFTA